MARFNLQKEEPGASHLFKKLIATGYWRTCLACSKKGQGLARGVEADLLCSFCEEEQPRSVFLQAEIAAYDPRYKNSRRCLSWRQKHADPAQYFKCGWCTQ